MISKMFKSKQSKIILSIVWGFGLSCLFKKVCKGRKCIIFSAPDPNIIKKNVYLFDNKCYKYTTKNTLCNSNPVENNN